MNLSKEFVNFLLDVASVFLTLLALEGGFRVRAHLRNQGVLKQDLEPRLEISKNGRAGLGHMIRLSRNRRIIYEFKPGIVAPDYIGAAVTINSQGFRGTDDPVIDGSPGFRILGVGDSFMFGQGVEDAEPYLAVPEKRLNQVYPDRRIQVINTAVPGYNTVMEVKTSRRKDRNINQTW